MKKTPNRKKNSISSYACCLLTGIFCFISGNTFADDSLLEQRVKDELETSNHAFVITPHKANYILPATYQTRTHSQPFEDMYPDEVGEIDQVEAKFQVSFKFPLWYNIFGDNGHLFFSYTNQSYWQVYNKDVSSPFRETNHEPEMFLLFNNDWKVAGLTNSFWGVGASHQSNGQASLLSRSWNRLYASMVFDKGPFAIGFKAWWRLPEDEKTSPNDPRGDDNPDINDYMGNVEITSVYGLDDHRFTMLLRNNLSTSENRGAVELTWSYPIMGNLRIYTQYFNGYGESLIDYNHHNQRFGIGLALNDIL
ncbi:phospholipase A [Shewanella intestini]|uniref:Phospholipase A1 n=1 Tax=Shewanella intestini TaxID=2017544 RepID=A0ABS5I1U3_9GAMM|nr:MULTISPECIES: phospholipase A [Shewanella]MBR9727972.1 phospholipase A [Shewanella intestini]MRG36477.1 phospholipase [Shewanella sp. XMDDZSB0408]